MISLLYIGISFFVGLIQTKCANVIPLRFATVFLFLFINVVIGVVHYRVFVNGSVFGYNLTPNLLVDVLSFLFFLFTVIAPARRLSNRQKSVVT